MLGLPSDLYDHCYSILSSCSEFQSNESLRAVFVRGALALYQYRIPETNTIEDRVAKCLEFLLGRRFGGEPVLALFLETLQNRYPDGDDLHPALSDLAHDIRVALAQSPTQYPQPTATSYAAVLRPLASENTTSRAQALFNHILEIDFNNQIELVEGILKEHRVAAFLIHGNPDYGPNCGQALLIERLFYLWNEGDEGHRIQINIGSPGVWAGIPTLWSHIAKYFELADNTSPDEIVDKIYQGWQTQNMVFIFYQVDYLVNTTPTYLAKWLQEFWQKIVAKALSNTQSGAANSSRNPTHLLLFLVDFSGRVCHAEDVYLAETGNDTRYPTIPLRLPPNSTFSLEVLAKWLRLPSVRELRPKGVTVNAQQLWDRSVNGIPELVYKNIFDFYELSWEGVAKKWLT